MYFVRWPRDLNALQLQKRMQIEKAPADQENIFLLILTADVQILTTQTNKETTTCKCSQHNAPLQMLTILFAAHFFVSN